MLIYLKSFIIHRRFIWKSQGMLKQKADVFMQAFSCVHGKFHIKGKWMPCFIQKPFKADVFKILSNIDDRFIRAVIAIKQKPFDWD